MDRHIVCFAVPSLEISLARLSDSLLRHKPIGIAPLNQPRSLCEVSSEARSEGVQVGMSVHHAIKLCPDLQILPSCPSRLSQAQHALFEAMERYAPAWEPVRAGSFFLDLSGTTRLFGPACDTASRIQRDVFHRHHLDGVLGIGSNKLIAHTAATLLQPAELYEVRPGSERAFMASFPLKAFSALSRPHMKQVLERIKDLNLRTFGDVADMPAEALEAVFGHWAVPLLRWAQGIDSSPVLPPPARRRIELSQVLEPNELDENTVRNALWALVEQLCRLLRCRQRVCHGLTLTLRYSDQADIMRHEQVKPGSCWEHDLMPPASRLLQRCFKRRIGVRTVTLAATRLLPPFEQCSLFESSFESAHRIRRQRLSLALDHLRERYGERIIRYGRGIEEEPGRERTYPARRPAT
jgi:DNA polymerase-4